MVTLVEQREQPYNRKVNGVEEQHIFYTFTFKGDPDDLQDLWMWFCGNLKGDIFRDSVKGVGGLSHQDFSFFKKSDAAHVKLVYG